MQNFNTNQTRHLYVAGAINANVFKDKNAAGSAAAANLDIALKATADGKMAFYYKNADGYIVRSDTFDPKKIVSLKKTLATSLAQKLQAHTISVDTSAVTLANLVGKTLDCIITIHEYADYDASSTRTFVASVVGNATNTASATAFHKALAEAIALALPTPDPKFPLINVFSNGALVTKEIAKAGSATGAAAGVVLVEGVQKYVQGKLSGEPCPFSVAFRLADGNTSDIKWGNETIAPSAISGYTVVPAAYKVADLEYFAAGERGDYFRGSTWPNDYPFKSAVDLSKNYDILSVEYYWAGDAENVQKSPRLIQVAAEHNNTAANDVCTQLYNTINAATLEGRVKALEDAQ